MLRERAVKAVTHSNFLLMLSGLFVSRPAPTGAQGYGGGGLSKTRGDRNLALGPLNACSRVQQLLGVIYFEILESLS